MPAPSTKDSAGSRPVGSVRIIGGDWRGRRIPVVAANGLRPSADRVRETLFNWLQFRLSGRRCLDLFAGSGVVGFEALSRGASTVTFVDSDSRVIAALEDTARRFHASERATIYRADAIQWLCGKHEPFDVVFLDPPFRQGLAARCADLLVRDGVLRPGADVYLEVEAGKAVDVPPSWRLAKHRTAGQVSYYLFQAVST